MLDKIVDFIRMMPGVYQLRKARCKRAFFSRNEYWGLWGDYRSFEHARQQINDPNKSTFDNDGVVDVCLEWFSQTSLFDYPIIYWLLRLIDEKKIDSMGDFGGHVGVKDYAYKNRIPPCRRLLCGMS